MWNQTRVSERLGIRYPIIQGPFGGGLSTVQLTAAVSNGAWGRPPPPPVLITPARLNKETFAAIIDLKNNPSR